MNTKLLFTVAAVAAITTGCGALGGGSSSSSPAPASSSPAPAPAAKPAPAPAPSNAGKIGPGMNDKGEVVDSKKVEAGFGQKVKGVGDWEGEITGKPGAASPFNKIQIGMPMRQVTDLIGQPSDQGAYVTGKAWIPFYFGADRHRYELVYKGAGRLIFAGGGMGDWSNGHLIWIIHNPNEPQYR